MYVEDIYVENRKVTIATRNTCPYVHILKDDIINKVKFTNPLNVFCNPPTL